MATNKNEGGHSAEMGAGLLAIAAAGLGYYFYASDDAKKHRKAAVTWAEQMKRDVIKRAEAVKAASPEAFGRAVDEAASLYADAKNIKRADVLRAAKELKRHWSKMRAEIKKSPKPVAKKAARKPVRTTKKRA